MKASFSEYQVSLSGQQALVQKSADSSTNQIRLTVQHQNSQNQMKGSFFVLFISACLSILTEWLESSYYYC